MIIIPIFRREMVAVARRGCRLQSERTSVATMLTLIVGGSFAAWLYWMGGVLDGPTLARISDEGLQWCVGIQAGLVGSVLVHGAMAIVRERERRTLDFVLITSLSSAEIVLGKLAACVVITHTALAVGLPFLLLLHTLGGVEPGWIGLALAGLISLDLLLSALAIWISCEAPDRRTAIAVFAIVFMAWLIGPFSLAVLPPKWGFPLPHWAAAINWQLATTSPVVVVFHIALGQRSWDQLLGEVVRMVALQLVAATIFTTAAIVRLRPAHLAMAADDRAAERRARRRPVWRWRPRPPVGDDPVLWREKYTSRDSGLLKAANIVIFGGLLIGMAAATVIYARPALAELGALGYSSAAIVGAPPEIHALQRLFSPGATTVGPPDMVRGEFNLFIRMTTVGVLMVMIFLVGGHASEALGVERARETWSSLLATPMTGRDILRSAVLAAAWRSRVAFAVVLALWALGLVAGAIHPLGFLVATLQLSASAGLTAVLGVLGSIRADKPEAATERGIAATLLLTGMGILPMLLPPGWNPVIIGAGSLPLMAWTSLVTYREVATAMAAPLDPHFSFAGISGGQMPLLVVTSWLVSIVGPALVGLMAWRYAIAHFDRLVGRPQRPGWMPEHRTPPAFTIPGPPHADAVAIVRVSPLAEADGAV